MTEAPPAHGIRVLIVEDHFDTAYAISKLLGRYGYIVRLAANVSAALKLAESELFDIMVSDITLPDGNGYDLMRQIRMRFGLRGIAMSGHGLEADLLLSSQAGFENHLIKPVTIEQLDATIRQVMSH